MTITMGAPAPTKLAERFTASANATDSPVFSNEQFWQWFTEKRRRNGYVVRRIPFAEMSGWDFDPATGNLGHHSGRFFTVEGLQVRTDWQGGWSWAQPIINQPEIGILGLVVKEFDGVLHCLMQAKMEPGNIDTIQLSPTVQATRSNYTGVHKGRPITHIEYFVSRRDSTVLADSLQSEHGTWFLRKRNRNMIVEVTDEVPEHDDFCWLTIGQVHQLLKKDNVVNMDTRSVLSCLPFGAAGYRTDGSAFRSALRNSLSHDQPARHTTTELLSWLTEIKARHELDQRSVPLSSVDRWYRDDNEIAHEDGKHFTIIATEVAAAEREVSQWTQPLLAPTEQGVVGFLARPIDGVLHLLAHARAEAGGRDIVELAPTVQCLPGNYRDEEPGRRPRYLDLIQNAVGQHVYYDSVQSEEGGRFYHADSRYRVVEAPDGFPLETPDEYRWITVHQATDLLQHSNYFNVQARSLIAGLHSGA
ncbi:NDP-hexose 2,3-dehydratase family protein [Kitasatospora sp. NBC_01302]|uniref:NDP-hexose 2,3-dehydratase family protein n=1 Tax=Kitasatospora sp. NBC_01302 TaxID=2903575 RepID=UPI002E14DC15|nr:NDP-hexose 2,3-dehydratase family protein [Kitasatospora sp. NBC_01302]